MSNNSFGVVDKEYTGRRVTQQGPIAANQPIELPIYISDKQQVMVHINNGTGSRLLTVNEYEYSAGDTSNLYLPTINVSASETVHVMFLGAVPYDQAFLLTAFAQTLLDDADATTALATLGAVSRAELQNQSYISATTAGTVPTYTASITPVPTLAAGLRVRAKFHAATSAASTLNLNALGAKPIKQYDATGAKVNAAIAANMLSDVEYDGADWVMLDTINAARTENFANSKTPSGWQKLEGGLIIQWGTASFAANNISMVQTTVAFPIAFPSACVHISGVQTSRASNDGGGTWAMRPTNKTLTNFLAELDTNAGSALYYFKLAQTAEWIAIGY